MIIKWTLTSRPNAHADSGSWSKARLRGSSLSCACGNFVES